jgi:ATP/maltotriose-dependent transcriptional regulator MalT
MGERYLRSTLTALLARAAESQGRLDEAEELTKLAEELAGPDDVETQAAWRSVRAKVFVDRGRLEEAARLSQEALQLLLPTDSAVMKVETLAGLGEVFTLLGEPTAAWAFNEALTLSEAKGNTAAVAVLRRSLGRPEAEPAPAS